MFSIQYCVCFYSLLYVCQSHFSGPINKTSAHKDGIKMEINVDRKNGENVIISKNNSVEENRNTNVSKIHESLDRDKTNEKNKFADDVEGSIIENNDRMSGINLTLNNSDITEEKQIVSKKNVNLNDYAENKTDTTNKNKMELKEDTKEASPKNDAVAKILQSNNNTVNVSQLNHSITLIDNKVKITKNSADITEVFNKNDSLTTISQNNENMTTIVPINDNMTNTLQKNDNTTGILQNLQKNNQTTNKNDIPKNIENYNTQNNNKKYDTPKNLKKRDTGIPDEEPNTYNPEEYQKQYPRHYRIHDLYKNNENYDLPRNIDAYDPRNLAQKQELDKEIQELNEYKPYYQNYEIKYKNVVDKTDRLQKDEHRIFEDHHRIIPQIQARLNNDLVKKSLDEFKMVRRKTHYTIPDVQIDIAKHDIDRYQDLSYNPKFHEYYDEGKIPRPRDYIEEKLYTKNVRPNNKYPIYQDINHIYPHYDELETQPNYKELNKILARQKEIIKKLSKLQTDGRKKNKNRLIDFDKLMSEVEAKRKLPNYTKFQFETTTTSTKLTTTEKPTTILTVFDETEVRRALKKDPQVRRILKIANLKREKYLDNVKKYMAKHNYTLEKNYTWPDKDVETTADKTEVEVTTVAV